MKILCSHIYSRVRLSDNFLRSKLYEDSNTKIFKYNFTHWDNAQKLFIFTLISPENRKGRGLGIVRAIIFFLNCIWFIEKKNLIPHTCAFYRRNIRRCNSLLLQSFKSTFCHRSNRKICQNYCTMPFTELWNVGKMSSNFVLKDKSTIITHIRMNNTIIQLHFPFCFKKTNIYEIYRAIQLFFHLSERQNIKVDVFLYYFTKRLRWSWRLKNRPLYYEPNSSEDTFHEIFHSRYVAESFCSFFFFWNFYLYLCPNYW